MKTYFQQKFCDFKGILMCSDFFENVVFFDILFTVIFENC